MHFKNKNKSARFQTIVQKAGEKMENYSEVVVKEGWCGCEDGELSR